MTAEHGTAPRAPKNLAELHAEHDALRAGEGKGATLEAIMARIAAEVTQEAEERRAAEARDATRTP
ncbi:MAG TPA: hypothetical protein VE033_19010 [Acetobacteraceae bacterium]|nr:hypothetical protein [Acetobacteraceae bacterium]